MIYAALLLGCLLLYLGGDWLLDGMLSIGKRYGLPKAIIGLVLVSLGTSAPELFVSVGSALQNHGGMAAGNVVGSNIINISIVLGLTVSIVALSVERVLRHQLLALIFISLLAVWVINDGHVTRLEGLSLIIAMIVSLSIAMKRTPADAADNEVESDNEQEPIEKASNKHPVLLTIGGIITLLIGAESLIWGGLGLASKLNLSETVVALTVTAIGTSLPEIAASIVAVTRRETSLALGNAIGSNMLNIGLVLGVSAVITPLSGIDLNALTLLFFIGLVCLIFILSVKPGYLAKWVGYGLLASYIVYITLLMNLN